MASVEGGGKGKKGEGGGRGRGGEGRRGGEGGICNPPSNGHFRGGYTWRSPSIFLSLSSLSLFGSLFFSISLSLSHCLSHTEQTGFFLFLSQVFIISWIRSLVCLKRRDLHMRGVKLSGASLPGRLCPRPALPRTSPFPPKLCHSTLLLLKQDARHTSTFLLYLHRRSDWGVEHGGRRID